MRTIDHPLEPEELMAWLDGELSPDRAAFAAEHLATCRDCHALAADLRGISDRLMEWQVQAPAMAAPVGAVGPAARRSRTRTWLLAGAGVAVAAGVVLIVVDRSVPVPLAVR